jgi:hypothetical protein
MMGFVMAELVDMVAVTSRSMVHNLNELKRLERNHFDHLGESEAKTVKACGHELNTLALHYKKHIASRRVGIDSMTCKEVESYFNKIAMAMEHLFDCIQEPPMAIHDIYHTYEHGHALWSLDGGKRASDANNVITQGWHDGNAAQWFLPKPLAAPPTGDGSNGAQAAPENRLEELAHLAKLMRRLSKIYQGLGNQGGAQEETRSILYDEKDALVFNLAELFKKKARPVRHAVDIATMIHQWASGDPNPQHFRFMAAYRTWKTRP